MIILGVVIIGVLAGFIIHIIITLLKLVAVFVGIILILGGVAAITFGSRWRNRRRWTPGPPESST